MTRCGDYVRCAVYERTPHPFWKGMEPTYVARMNEFARGVLSGPRLSGEFELAGDGGVWELRVRCFRTGFVLAVPARNMRVFGAGLDVTTFWQDPFEADWETCRRAVAAMTGPVTFALAREDDGELRARFEGAGMRVVMDGPMDVSLLDEGPRMGRFAWNAVRAKRALAERKLARAA